MKYLNYRYLNGYAAFIALLLLIAAGYLQFALKLPPCPLCVMQRLVVMLLGLLFLAGAIYVPKKKPRKIFNGVIFAVAVFGMALAGRHSYLQLIPQGSTTSCGPGLNFIFQNLSLTEAVKALLLGTGDCGEVNWTFLALSIPEWTFIFMLLFAGVAFFQMTRKKTGC